MQHAAPITPSQAGDEEAGATVPPAFAADNSRTFTGVAGPYDLLPDLLRLQRGRSGGASGEDAGGECDLVAVLSRRSGNVPGFTAVAASFRHACGSSSGAGSVSRRIRKPLSCLWMRAEQT